MSEPTVQATALTSDGPRAGSSDVSAHFINNVLAAAASYIDEDPDLARDVLAELGQFLAYGLRSAPAPATLGRELDHLSTYLRLQGARFPDRIDAALPAAVEFAQAPTEIAAGSLCGAVAVALEQRLGSIAGPCVLRLRIAGDGLELELRGPDDLIGSVTPIVFSPTQEMATR